MTVLVKNIVRIIFFIGIQVYVFGKMPLLHQFITPYLYFLFILWLPFNIGRWWLLMIGFSYGMLLDYFLGYPGLHAAPCVLIAYLRPFILSLFIAQDTTIEQSYTEPSLKSMGVAPYFLYILVLTFVHHSYLVLIEWLQFGTFLYFIGKVGCTLAISLLLIAITELLFARNTKLRTAAE
jgi:hypothetical protein